MDQYLIFDICGCLKNLRLERSGGGLIKGANDFGLRDSSQFLWGGYSLALIIAAKSLRSPRLVSRI